MEWLDSLNLPPEFAGPATIVFVVAGAVFAAWSRLKGKAEGAPQPKVQEFYAAGQLADMGPVKELVEGVGLLIQQQVRTNLHLEAVADALGKTAELYEAQLQHERNEAEIEAEVERRLDLERRNPPRHTPT